MSFILENNDLINILLKQAQAADASIVAKKLLNKLEKQYSNTPNTANISSEIPTSLNVSDLQSIGKLLQFLDNNKVKLNGIRLAYSDKEYETLPEEEQAKLATISVNMSRDAATRKWNEADYWANLGALVPYVKYLQEKAVAMEKSGDAQGQVLRVMVGKLIDSINTIKPDSGLTRQKQKSTPENPNVLSDDTVLDDFNVKTFDAKSPYDGHGSNQVKLYAKDLKNREALNAWLMGGEGGEAKIVSYDSSGPQTVEFTNEKANPCIMINVLYLRAKRWLQLSKSTEDTKKYNYYLSKISELAPVFTDSDGKACTVGGSSSQSLITALIPGEKEGPASPAGSAPQLSPAVAQQIISTLPFSIREIDFQRIRSFFDSLSQLMEAAAPDTAIGKLAPTINAKTAATNSLMTQFSNTYTSGDTIIPLGQTPMQFVSMLKDKITPGKQFFPALRLLTTILDNTRQIIEYFYSIYGYALNNSQKAFVLGQIGRTPEDNSIYSRNYNALEILRTSGKVQ